MTDTVRRILYNVEHAAEMLDISPQMVRKLTAQGRLRPARVGDRVLYAHETLQEFARESTEPANPSSAIANVSGVKRR